MIYTIGNSHSLFGWEHIKNIKITHLGPKLMYSITHYLPKLPLNTLRSDDALIFCYGEIDIRCHVKKHSVNEDSYKEIIDGMVVMYLSHIKTICGGVVEHPYVFSVVPTRRIDSTEPYDISTIPGYWKYNAPRAEPFPYVGSDEERKTYTLYMNEKLKELCPQYGIGFFDVYKQYCDVDGFLDMRYSDGVLHINDPVHIKEVLNSTMKNFWKED